MTKQWFILHALSGHELKVKKNIASRIEQEEMSDRISEVLIPSEKTNFWSFIAISSPVNSSLAMLIALSLYLSGLYKIPLTHFPISSTAIVCHLKFGLTIPGKIFLDIQ